MPKIVIENLFNRTIQVTDLSKTILAHLQDHRVDWMHACGGKGRCTSCKIIVREGKDNITPPTESELRYQAILALSVRERLSCQARITGDIVIAAPREYKLPHISYSDNGGD